MNRVYRVQQELSAFAKDAAAAGGREATLEEIMIHLEKEADEA